MSSVPRPGEHVLVRPAARNTVTMLLATRAPLVSALGGTRPSSDPVGPPQTIGSCASWQFAITAGG